MQCIRNLAVTDSFSAGQDISRILWNLKMHYRVSGSPSLSPFLSQLHPSDTLYTLFLLKTHILLGLPSCSVGFLTKMLYSFLISPTRSTFVTHLNLLDVIIIIIFGQECK